jgi:hypothetical protein
MISRPGPAFVAALAIVAALSATTPARAQSTDAPNAESASTAATSPSVETSTTPIGNTSVRPHRRRRDRWSNTLSLGVTFGAGSPLGVLGAFLEYRPIRWVSASVGAGLGGTFGAAVGGTLYVDPIVTRVVALGVGASVSRNFAYRSGVVVQGFPPIPDHSDWFSIELESQIRPNRGLLVRIGVGYGFLLNGGDYNIATESELAYLNLPHIPVPSPIDALHAAARHENYGMWFVHLDLAPVWRL